MNDNHKKAEEYKSVYHIRCSVQEIGLAIRSLERSGNFNHIDDLYRIIDELENIGSLVGE